MAPQANDTPYYLVPNLTALDPSAREIELGAHSWIQATVIDDEDLTFGGKALSTWYEEERQRLSRYSDEEQQRGRQRVRAHYSSHHHHSNHHHHHSSKMQSAGSDKKS